MSAKSGYRRNITIYEIILYRDQIARMSFFMNERLNAAFCFISILLCGKASIAIDGPCSWWKEEKVSCEY